MQLPFEQWNEPAEDIPIVEDYHSGEFSGVNYGETADHVMRPRCSQFDATIYLPEGQALARHMKGRSDSHVVSSHVCRSSVRATSTHSPEFVFG